MHEYLFKNSDQIQNSLSIVFFLIVIIIFSFLGAASSRFLLVRAHFLQQIQEIFCNTMYERRLSQ